MVRTGAAPKIPPSAGVKPARPSVVTTPASPFASLHTTPFDVARLILQPAFAADIAPHQWPGVIHVMVEQRVASLVYSRLRDTALPGIVHHDLEKIYRANLARNIFLGFEQKTLHAAFRQESLPVFMLKGPELSESLYDDPGARQVADLDLLIRPADLPAAARLLAKVGFERAISEPLERFKKCRDVLYARNLPGARRIFADVHLRLRAYGRTDALAESIWRDGMGDENLLLYLCLNVMTHRFARLQTWLDLATLLQKKEKSLNWMRVRESALKLEWPSGVFFCLRFAAELAARRVPDTVMCAIAPGRFDRWWIESILGRDAETLLARAPMLDGPRGTLAALGCERGLPRKLALAASILFPPAPALRQMDAPARRLSLPFHYSDRIARKVLQFAHREKARP